MTHYTGAVSALRFNTDATACMCHLQVYTFAGPRAGDSEFAAYIGNCYASKVFRIVHSADLVPKVACCARPKLPGVPTEGYWLHGVRQWDQNPT